MFWFCFVESKHNNFLPPESGARASGTARCGNCIVLITLLNTSITRAGVRAQRPQLVRKSRAFLSRARFSIVYALENFPRLRALKADILRLARANH